MYIYAISEVKDFDKKISRNRKRKSVATLMKNAKEPFLQPNGANGKPEFSRCPCDIAHFALRKSPFYTSIKAISAPEMGLIAP